ncbi:MAG: hypothetical protein MUP97_10625 [Acidimicrobiia bacterium]|nr:hypothetical protein [Acidimicrobiia bacterium]
MSVDLRSAGLGIVEITPRQKIEATQPGCGRHFGELALQESALRVILGAAPLSHHNSRTRAGPRRLLQLEQ